jgi:hypothetical protein
MLPPRRSFDAIQDDITQRIVTTLVTHIDKAELEHT